METGELEKILKGYKHPDNEKLALKTISSYNEIADILGDDISYVDEIIKRYPISDVNDEKGSIEQFRFLKDLFFNIGLIPYYTENFSPELKKDLLIPLVNIFYESQNMESFHTINFSGDRCRAERFRFDEILSYKEIGCVLDIIKSKEDEILELDKRLYPVMFQIMLKPLVGLKNMQGITEIKKSNTEFIEDKIEDIKRISGLLNELEGIDYDSHRIEFLSSKRYKGLSSMVRDERFLEDAFFQRLKAIESFSQKELNKILIERNSRDNRPITDNFATYLKMDYSSNWDFSLKSVDILKGLKRYPIALRYFGLYIELLGEDNTGKKIYHEDQPLISGLNILGKNLEQVSTMMDRKRTGIGRKIIVYEQFAKKLIDIRRSSEDYRISPEFDRFCERYVSNLMIASRHNNRIDAILDCSDMLIENYHVLRQHGGGRWSDTYIITPEGQSDKQFYRLLKLPKIKSTKDPNFFKLLQKYEWSNESINPYKNLIIGISNEEESINNIIFNTSEDSFNNFEYQPLPKFLGHTIVIRPIGLERVLGEFSMEVPGLMYEYIHGKTIKEQMSEKSESRKIVDILARSAYCLNYIHTKGITHNDIKPENFMVGKNGRVYLLDLAFSRTECSVSTIKGSRVYTAPERIASLSNPTEKSDQYSFGVMAYELVTGIKPLDYHHAEGNRARLARMVRKGILKPTDIFNVKPDIDPMLGKIIMKTLSYDPKDRYASMQDVEDELVELMKRYQKG